MKGNIVVRRRPPGHNVPLELRRGGVTFIGVAAANRAIQGALPLICIAGQRVLRVRTWRAVIGDAPPRVKLWREKSSWNSAIIMEKILETIIAEVAVCLGPRDQLALVMDCAAIHLSKRILQKARSLRIWILLVPAKCTHLFQVLDTHCFFGYKASLRKELGRLQQNHLNGFVSQEDWLRCLFRVSADFFQTKIGGKRLSKMV